MTTQELRTHFNEKVIKLEEPSPKTFEVDHETYANVCQSVFEHLVKSGDGIFSDWNEYFVIGVKVGKQNSGIMFKGIELILKGN